MRVRTGKPPPLPRFAGLWWSGDGDRGRARAPFRARAGGPRRFRYRPAQGAIGYCALAGAGFAGPTTATLPPWIWMVSGVRPAFEW